MYLCFHFVYFIKLPVNGWCKLNNIKLSVMKSYLHSLVLKQSAINNICALDSFQSEGFGGNSHAKVMGCVGNSTSNQS